MILTGNTLQAGAPGWLPNDGVEPYPPITFIEASSLYGVAALTEGTDAVAGTGTDRVYGIAAISEGHDTPLGVGTDRVSGLAALSENTDSALGVGSERVSAAASITEAHDGVSATGIVPSSAAGLPTARKRRYGVRDGPYLLLFDTLAQAEEAQHSLKQEAPAHAPARKIRVRAAERIHLPALRTAAAAVDMGPRYEQLLAANHLNELALLHAAVGYAQRQKAREEEEIAVILLHL